MENVMENVMEEMDVQEEVMEEQTESTINEETELDDVTLVMENNNAGNEFIKGLLVGFGIGAVVGLSYAWVERRKRLKLLAAMEEVIIYANDLRAGNDITIDDRAKIKSVADAIEKPEDIIAHIQDQLGKRTMSKKETKKWLDALNDFAKLTLVYDKDRVAAELKAKVKAMEEAEVEEVEVLNEQ